MSLSRYYVPSHAGSLHVTHGRASDAGPDEPIAIPEDDGDAAYDQYVEGVGDE